MPGAFLAEFELYVMLAIAQLADDAYGAAVRQEIESRTQRPRSNGSAKRASSPCAPPASPANQDAPDVTAALRRKARRICAIRPRCCPA